jgi:hypothetical protein
MRRETMAARSIEIANMRAADAAVSDDERYATDDLRRRRVMAERERELVEWRSPTLCMRPGMKMASVS